MYDKDYYKIMGVSADASDKEIKTAYRKLARKFHPDISKETDAEERFKEMSEAYDVLRDPAKRKEYDQLRNYQAHQQGSQTTSDFEGGPHFYQGAEFDPDIFETLFGHSRYRQQPMAGQNYQGALTISLEEAFTGTAKEVQIPTSENPTGTQTLKVKIPAGIKSGQQIRLAGQGGAGVNGGARGDVFITINVNKHPLFDVVDNDVYLTLPIAPWEAALGANITVPTLSGKIDLKIPAGSQGGQKLRIKNRGLPGKTPGNQYVLLKIITPPAKSKEATDLYQKMAETIPFDPREKMGVST